MTRRRIPAALLVLLCLTSVAWSKTEFFKLEDLKPGMKGIGRTCYQGSKPEEFQVEILGVMKGISPGANAVLAKFSGGPLGTTGVFEGMSGSPVFIDGKLLGAVAFSFAFPKEAIGGITPISQMVDAFTEGDQPGLSGPKIILKRSMLWDYTERLKAAGAVPGRPARFPERRRDRPAARRVVREPRPDPDLDATEPERFQPGGGPHVRAAAQVAGFERAAGDGQFYLPGCRGEADGRRRAH